MTLVAHSMGGGEAIRTLSRHGTRRVARLALVGATEITIPTLVVHGEHDQQAPIAICGERSATLVPNARFLRYENAAHGLFLTHAERLDRDLLAFVGG